jgi:Stress responsive A/B Barrel Domain
MTKGDTVIRHIVMWKLKERAEGASRAENLEILKEKLEGCRDIVPGMLDLQVGIATAGLDSTYDLVMTSDFADKASLDAYQIHPTHLALKQFAGAVREARQCVDYELPT